MTGKEMGRANQLRALIRELEGQPVSAQRDALLKEARGRVVDVESGAYWRPGTFEARRVPDDRSQLDAPYLLRLS